jgi:hypothetical protein
MVARAEPHTDPARRFLAFKSVRKHRVTPNSTPVISDVFGADLPAPGALKQPLPHSKIGCDERAAGR